MDFEKLKGFINDLDDEQKKELKKIVEECEEVIKVGYEKPEEDEIYWVINENKANSVEKYAKWIDDHTDNDYYDNANCYTIKEVAEADARADLLMRKLRRFAKLNNKRKINWNDKRQYKYCIKYSHETENILISRGSLFTRVGGIYFADKETAQKAIDKFHGELEWYFTEYSNNW